MFEWTTLFGETNSRVKSLASRSESISARERALFERVARSRGVLRRRDGNDISSTFRGPPNTKSEKGSRETNFPLRFFAWFSIIEFSFSLFILSLPCSSPFTIVTHTLAFLTQYRSCTLSRKSKASGVDLPTSSARRRKSTWGKEPGNSPRLNSNR